MNICYYNSLYEMNLLNSKIFESPHEQKYWFPFAKMILGCTLVHRYLRLCVYSCSGTRVFEFSDDRCGIQSKKSTGFRLLNKQKDYYIDTVLKKNWLYWIPFRHKTFVRFHWDSTGLKDIRLLLGNHSWYPIWYSGCKDFIYAKVYLIPLEFKL